MGLLADIISAISVAVVANLAAGGYPALADGAIVVGTAAEFEQSAPPRIIFDPTPGSEYVSPEYYSGGSTVIHTTERELEGAQRTVSGDNVSFLVHCWGYAGVSAAPVDHYDVTRALAHAVRAALQKIVPGAYKIEDKGRYRDTTKIVLMGRWFTFGVTIYTPVLESLVPYDRSQAYASDTVAPSGTDEMLVPFNSPTTGPHEPGCT